MVINIHMRLVDVAGDAVTLGAAMNQSVLNTANALGALLGDPVITAGYGYPAPAPAGAALSMIGLGILGMAAVTARRDGSA
ncbi:hypothetical protein OG698_08560 [Streptomyces sp. NBC_01003]|uniref:hypothetical protein n=1 Tax=Streptomyces sp. NBC_01003 TaxID=2903714 RepID=UPI00386D3CF8|nr:hypothetical protein OG698_08560 [Streptomyces sp. NBC_01003]